MRNGKDKFQAYNTCSYVEKHIIMSICDYRRGLDWWIDLLTT
jgi:hypothetical protein